jgi:hypothetical protein
MLRLLAVVGVAAGLAAAPAAGAPPRDKAKGRAKGKDQDQTVVVFGDRHREAVRAYWIETYGRGNCPPGLAKKRNGCLPPGQAKKRYRVGARLPATVVIHPLPAVLVPRLGPPPPGYEYVMVDGDVLKLAVGTKLVADAISGLMD